MEPKPVIRKLAAIVVADVVGFSRHMERDDAGRSRVCGRFASSTEARVKIGSSTNVGFWVVRRSLRTAAFHGATARRPVEKSKEPGSNSFEGMKLARSVNQCANPESPLFHRLFDL
jgi:hypothetical protein